jgi:hypothetical protein
MKASCKIVVKNDGLRRVRLGEGKRMSMIGMANTTKAMPE